MSSASRSSVSRRLRKPHAPTPTAAARDPTPTHRQQHHHHHHHHHHHQQPEHHTAHPIAAAPASAPDYVFRWTGGAHAYFRSVVALAALVARVPHEPADHTAALAEWEARMNSGTRVLPGRVEREVADHAAFLAAAEPGVAACVAAVCVEERELRDGSGGLRFRVASGAGRVSPRVLGRLGNVCKVLRKAVRNGLDEEHAREAVWRRIMDLQAPKVQADLAELFATSGKTRSLPELVDSLIRQQPLSTTSATDDASRALLEEILDLAQRIADDTGSGTTMEALLQACYRARRSRSFKAFLRTALREHARPLAQTIERLGRHRAACHALVAAALKHPHAFRTLDVEPVPDLPTPPPAYTPSQPPTPFVLAAELLDEEGQPGAAAVADVNRRLQKLSGLSEPRLVARYADMCTAPPQVHAELQLVKFYEENPFVKRPVFIGLSKKACYLCTLFLELHGKFGISKSHHNLFAPWDIPRVRCAGSADVRRFHAIADRITLQLEQDACLALARRHADLRPYAPTSSHGGSTARLVTPSPRPPRAPSSRSPLTGGGARARPTPSPVLGAPPLSARRSERSLRRVSTVEKDSLESIGSSGMRSRRSALRKRSSTDADSAVIGGGVGGGGGSSIRSVRRARPRKSHSSTATATTIETRSSSDVPQRAITGLDTVEEAPRHECEPAQFHAPRPRAGAPPPVLRRMHSDSRSVRAASLREQASEVRERSPELRAVVEEAGAVPLPVSVQPSRDPSPEEIAAAEAAAEAEDITADEEASRVRARARAKASVEKAASPPLAVAAAEDKAADEEAARVRARARAPVEKVASPPLAASAVAAATVAATAERSAPSPSAPAPTVLVETTRGLSPAATRSSPLPVARASPLVAARAGSPMIIRTSPPVMKPASPPAVKPATPLATAAAVTAAEAPTPHLGAGLGLASPEDFSGGVPLAFSPWGATPAAMPAADYNLPSVDEGLVAMPRPRSRPRGMSTSLHPMYDAAQATVPMPVPQQQQQPTAPRRASSYQHPPPPYETGQAAATMPLPYPQPGNTPRRASSYQDSAYDSGLAIAFMPAPYPRQASPLPASTYQRPTHETGAVAVPAALSMVIPRPQSRRGSTSQANLPPQPPASPRPTSIYEHPTYRPSSSQSQRGFASQPHPSPQPPASPRPTSIYEHPTYHPSSPRSAVANAAVHISPPTSPIMGPTSPVSPISSPVSPPRTLNPGSSDASLGARLALASSSTVSMGPRQRSGSDASLGAHLASHGHGLQHGPGPLQQRLRSGSDASLGARLTHHPNMSRTASVVSRLSTATSGTTVPSSAAAVAHRRRRSRENKGKGKAAPYPTAAVELPGSFPAGYGAAPTQGPFELPAEPVPPLPALYRTATMGTTRTTATTMTTGTTGTTATATTTTTATATATDSAPSPPPTRLRPETEYTLFLAGLLDGVDDAGELFCGRLSDARQAQVRRGKGFRLQAVLRPLGRDTVSGVWKSVGGLRVLEVRSDAEATILDIVFPDAVMRVEVFWEEQQRGK